MAITLAGGEQVALEVQLGALSDAAWLARHQDYARADITDVWLWHEQTWIPRVMFASGQPRWILNPDTRKLGLLYASPGRDASPRQHSAAGCGQVHWLPCPGDATGIHWMPLQAARLTIAGIRPSPEALTKLARQATAHASPPGPAANTRAAARCTMPAAAGTHYAFKYESRPPGPTRAPGGTIAKPAAER